MGSLFIFNGMSKREDPAIIIPGTHIIVIYPGANPKDIENLVVRPIEEALNALSDIDSIESTSSPNFAEVSIDFKIGSDPDRKYSDVVEKVDGARSKLPDGVSSIDFVKSDISRLKIYQYALIAPAADYASMVHELESLKDELSRIDGLQGVELGGYPKRRVEVALDLEKLASMGLSPGLVGRSIQSSNAGIPGGAVDLGANRYGLTVEDSLGSIEDIKAIAMPMRGRSARLEDLAEVRMSDEDQDYIFRVDGEKAIFLSAAQKKGSNIFAIDKEVKAKTAAFERRLPSGMRARFVVDQSKSVVASVSEFMTNLLEAILLVGLVVFAGLGARMSIVVMINIPIVCAMAIGFIGLSGFEIEQMSINGLAISLGMIVDDAIVGTENISRHQRLGYDLREATILGVRQIRRVMIVGTLTTVLTFIPIALLKSKAGEYIKSMPVIVVSALLLSLALAITFVPTLSTWLLNGARVRDDRLLLRAIRRFSEGSYRSLLAAALRRPGSTIAVALVVFALGIGVLSRIPTAMLPMYEKNLLFVDVRTGPGASLATTDAAARAVEAALLGHGEVASTICNVGKGNPKIFVSINSENPRSDYAQILVELKRAKPSEYSAFAERLRAEFAYFPGSRIAVREIQMGASVDAPIALRIIGKDNVVLASLGDQAERAFRRVPGVVNVQNSFDSSSSEFRVAIDRDRASSLGIAVSDISAAVRTAISGRTVTKFRDASGDEFDVDIDLRRGAEDGAKLSDLERIYLPSGSGAMVPLAQVSSIGFARGSQRIFHIGTERTLLLTADAALGRNVNALTAEIMRGLSATPLPEGYRYELAGDSASSKESFGSLGALFLASILAMLVLLTWQYGNIAQPLVIFSAVPLSLAGAAIGLLVSGNDLSFTALLGITSLAGIVVKNSVILIDFINERRREGRDIDEAIAEAGEVRMMPIFLTTGTMVMGLMPLALSGSKLWGPMAWVQVCGLIVSTALTLVVVPVLYKILCKKMPGRDTMSDAR